jgi:hypothetical protein
LEKEEEEDEVLIQNSKPMEALFCHQNSKKISQEQQKILLATKNELSIK